MNEKLLSDPIREIDPKILPTIRDEILGRYCGPGLVVEGVSCKHRWKDVPPDAKDTFGFVIPPGSQACRLCGATCVRSKVRDESAGTIEEYDRTSGYFGPQLRMKAKR